MYTNPKPYVMPGYATAPWLSRQNLMFAGALLSGALAGGVAGVLNTPSDPGPSVQAASATPAAASASAVVLVAGSSRFATRPGSRR